MDLSLFQKHTVSQMTGLSREQVEEVLEAINYVQSDTVAFGGPVNGPHSDALWDETVGKKRRKAHLSSPHRRGRPPLIVHMRP